MLLKVECGWITFGDMFAFYLQKLWDFRRISVGDAFISTNLNALVGTVGACRIAGE